MTLETLCPPRFGTQRRPERETLGPAVGEVARLLGKPFMPWQQYVADVILEIDPRTGRLAYSQFGLTVPRQSGKSVFILAKSVHRASATRFFGRRQNIVYTAQTRKDARKKWEDDYAADIDGSRVFKKKIAVHKGNGNEHFSFTNGSRFGIESATEKSGHGGTLDEAYIDEAFAQIDARLEQAFRPAMITRPNKQLGWISTAGWTDASAYLQAKVKLGRAAVLANSGHGLAYFEWSAPDDTTDADCGDPDVWRACMPALGHVREDGSGITEESIADEYATMELPDFKRAYLNMWVPKPVEAVESVIDPNLWAARLDLKSQIVSAPTFALDVSPSQSWAAIAVAGLREDSKAHIEITSSQGVVDHRAGIDWIVPRFVQLKERWPGLRVVIAAGSAAESLVPALLKAGLEMAEPIKGGEIAAACGLFYGLDFWHIGQTELTTALAAARKNVEDGEQGWRWGRKKSAGDITALYAATLALWAAIAASNTDMDPAMNVW